MVCLPGEYFIIHIECSGTPGLRADAGVLVHAFVHHVDQRIAVFQEPVPKQQVSRHVGETVLHPDGDTIRNAGVGRNRAQVRRAGQGGSTTRESRRVRTWPAAWQTAPPWADRRSGQALGFGRHPTERDVAEARVLIHASGERASPADVPVAAGEPDLLDGLS